jgi:hypothetical protein
MSSQLEMYVPKYASMAPKVLEAYAHEHDVVIRYRKGRRVVTDYVYTEPIGGWTELDFNGDECDYVAFLNTMVYKNVDVFRKMATLLLDELLDVPYKNRIQLLNAMKILDPTFTPPWINIHCTWQQELVEKVVNKTFDVIGTCYNIHRLERYVTVLQSLRLQTTQ